MADEEKNEGYEVKAGAGGNLSKSDIAVCVSIIGQGGAVDANSAKTELPSASVVVVAKRGKEIVGVGAVKRRRVHYAEARAKDSGVPLDPKTLELGYVAVDKKHRQKGLSHRIVAELLSQNEGTLFATTDCAHMKKTLAAAGFVRKGREWKGRRGQLSLWVKD